MPSSPKPKQQQELGIRLEQLKSLFTQIPKEIEHLSSSGDLAPNRAWIVRYQARRRGGAYWYYKWQSHEAIFRTKEGKMSCHKYIGKAGSPAYLTAVEMLVRRTKIEGLEQALHPLELGLLDLVQEATRHQKD